MKNSLFEHFVNIFSWLAYGLTCFLSCYAVSKIMNSPEQYWIVVAIVAGAVVNTTEMLAWHVKNRNSAEKIRLEVLINRAYTDSDRNEYETLLAKRQKWHPWAIFILMASLSIAGSFFSLQSGYDRGKEIETVQDAVMKQLALREGVIKEYQLNSESARYQADIKRRLSNMYLNKSDEFLNKAEAMLGTNAKELDYLKNNVENKVALSIYNSYSTLFGGKPETWAIIFNTLLSLIIECGFAYLTYEAYHINNPRSYIKELGEKDMTVPEKHIGVPKKTEQPGHSHTPVPVTAKNGGSQCDVTPPTVTVTPQVTPVTGRTPGNTQSNSKGHTIGFRFNKNTPIVPSELQEQIIEVYEEHKKRNIVEQLNISELARVANRSRKYVYTTLQNFTDFKARE